MNQGMVVGAGDGGSGSGDGSAGQGDDSEGASGGSGGDDASGDNRSAPDPQKYPTCGTESHPVDVVTGRVFTHPVVDLALPGPLPFSFHRSYSSTACRLDQGLGPGWAHSLGWFVEVSRKSVRVWNERGVSVAFSLPQVGHTVLGDWGWALRREPWGFAVDANDDVWRVFSTSFDEGKTFRLTAIDDRNKNRIAITYEEGRLVQVVDSGGRVVNFTSTAQGRIASIQVKNAEHQGRWIAFARYDYDAEGRLARVTDADDYAWTYAYDERNRLVRDTDRVGLSFCFRYDAQDRGIEAWGEYLGKKDPSLAEDLPRFLADGRTRAKGIYHRKFEYYPQSYTEVTDSTESRRYFGNKKGTLDKAVTGGAVTSSTYDDRGFEVEKTDPMGATTRWVRDERGRPLETIDPLGRRQTIVRDANGLPVEVLDTAGGVTRVDRDQHGNLTAVRDASGTITQFTHDARGVVTSVTGPTGTVVRYASDPNGNVIRVEQHNGGVWTYTYNAFGLVTSVKNPLGAETRYAYTDRGDLVAGYDSTGGVTRYEYDGERHLTQVVTPRGCATHFVWGGFHKLCARRDANGHARRLTYSREGELVAVYNEREEAHRLQYDRAGRLVVQRSFDGCEVRYRNDAAGRVVRIENGVGEITALVYDLAGQLVSRQLADGVTETFEYDARGSLVRATNATGEFHFERDALGRITRERQRVGDEEHWVKVVYDAAGRRAGRTTSLAHVEKVERDASGTRTGTWIAGVGKIERVTDVLAREIRRELPGGGSIESAFDLAGRLVRRLVRSPRAAATRALDEPEWLGPRDQGVTAMVSYEYDADGGLSARHDSQRGTTRYDYDPVGQLLSAIPDGTRGETFRYDATGNVLDALSDDPAGGYGPGNRLLRKGDVSYAWDDDGRLTSKTEHSAQGRGVWRYSWNAAGMLEGVVTPEGRTVEFRYDPFGRRVAKTEKVRDGVVWKEVARTRFVWDGEVVAHEIRTASQFSDPVVETRTYLMEERSFAPVAHLDSTGAHYYACDGTGAPEAMISADGARVTPCERSVWGSASGRGPSPTPFRLAGQYADDETGLHYNRCRYYDPDAARYVSRDPVGLGANANAFLYPCPTVDIDPLGLILTQPDIVSALRQQGSPESLATASLIKRGSVQVQILPTDPYGGGPGIGGRQPWGTNVVQIYEAGNKDAKEAAGVAAHETKHVLQGLTPQTYRQCHEVEAFQWQRAAGDPRLANLSDAQIAQHVATHPAYANVPK
jgi:RHS repeat-associated protein